MKYFRYIKTYICRNKERNKKKWLTVFMCLMCVFFFIIAAPGQEPTIEPGEGMSIDQFLLQALPPEERRVISFDPATGILTVKDTKTNHAIIRELLKKFDAAPRQIMIEAKFVEVSVKDLDEFGIEWYFYRPGRVDDKWAHFGVGDPGRPDTTGIFWTEGLARFPATATGADLFVSITKLRGDYLRAYLHALEEQGKANLLSAPRVTTLSGRPAIIEIIREIPYTSEFRTDNIGTAENPIWRRTYTTDIEEIGITLEVTPTVGEGTDIITLDIYPSVDVLKDRIPIHTLIPKEMGQPVIDTRATETSVYVKSGSTIILGGLIKDEDFITEKRVPLISSIPLLGNLFKYKHRTREKTNLLIFITATLITVDGEEI